MGFKVGESVDWKISWSCLSCVVVFVLGGGSNVSPSALCRAEVKSFTAVTTRFVLSVVGVRKLCGSHLRVSIILVQPVCLYHILWHM